MFVDALHSGEDSVLAKDKGASTVYPRSVSVRACSIGGRPQMKLKSVCMVCTAKENCLDESMLLSVEYRDGTLRATCPQGHESRTIVNAADFQILFEFGGMALLDGFPREAVSSFAAALESAYMCYVSTVLLNAQVPAHAAEAAMKALSRSERQLGAFVSLFALREEMPPPLLPPEMVELRNNCTHKGAIPAREEAVKYGQCTLEILDPLLAVLTDKYEREFNEVIHHRAWKAALAEGFNPASAAIPTMLSKDREEIAKGTLADRLVWLEKYRVGIWER